MRKLVFTALALACSGLALNAQTTIDFVDSGGITGTVSSNEITFSGSLNGDDFDVIATAGSPFEVFGDNGVRFGYSDGDVDGGNSVLDDGGNMKEEITFTFQTPGGSPLTVDFGGMGLGVQTDLTDADLEYAINGGSFSLIDLDGTTDINILQNETGITSLIVRPSATADGDSAATSFGFVDLNVAVIPEPSTYAMMGLGALALAGTMALGAAAAFTLGIAEADITDNAVLERAVAELNAAALGSRAPSR